MERIASPEEKIRRAEEISYRRKSQVGRSNIARVNVNEQKDYGLFKKLVLQILICLTIYFIFYLIQNGNYLFSEDVINKAKEILAYDINFQETFEQIGVFINSSFNNEQDNNAENNSAEGVNGEQSNEIGGEQNNTSDSENDVQNNTGEQSDEQENGESSTNNEQNGENTTDGQEGEDVSGGQVGEATTDNDAIGDAGFEDVVLQEKSQEELDIERLQTLSWVKPVSGTITSEFGQRESASSIISPNHTGIDIGANKGTVIVAAIEGNVTISSTEGEYGYHIKITNGDVSTLYAHCSKLYVNVGDYVSQGQAIAEVGSTGNSTGPHLHFEVIRDGRYINPRNVIQF